MTTTRTATAFSRSLRTPIVPDPNLRYQASQFMDWFHQLPLSITVTNAFSEWADSKDFAPTDRDRIWGCVLDRLDERIDGPFDPRVSLALDSPLDEEDP